MKNKDFFKRLFKQVEKDIREQSLHDIIEELKLDLSSSKAKESADLVNELYKRYEVKNNSGEVLQVADPSTIIDQIEYVDGNIRIGLTEEQRRFMISDLIYGLRAINLKYIER